MKKLQAPFFTKQAKERYKKKYGIDTQAIPSTTTLRSLGTWAWPLFISVIRANTAVSLNLEYCIDLLCAVNGFTAHPTRTLVCTSRHIKTAIIIASGPRCTTEQESLRSITYEFDTFVRYLELLGWHCPDVQQPPRPSQVRYDNDGNIPHMYRTWAQEWLHRASQIPRSSRAEVHNILKDLSVRKPLPPSRTLGIRRYGMNFPFQYNQWYYDRPQLFEEEVNEYQMDLDEVEEHHARESYELTHSNSNDHRYAMILQQGFAHNTTLVLYFHTCLLRNPNIWAQIQFTRTSINHIRKLIKLTKMCEEFHIPCPMQPETVIARTFCHYLQHNLDLTNATGGVDFDNRGLFPPQFREVAYWEKVLQCTGHYPNVLSGITMFRFHAQSKSNKDQDINEVTITLPLLHIMRLCAAGESTAQDNKRSLLQGSCNFMPLEEDCALIQSTASMLLDTIKNRQQDRGRDLSLINSLVEEGLFNTRINLNTQQNNMQLSAGNREQGITIYITSLPLNLYSGITPIDDEVSVQFDGDIRHFLTDSHPLHINEGTMYWKLPLKELIWNPPTYIPWVGSWAFPPRTA